MGGGSYFVISLQETMLSTPPSPMSKSILSRTAVIWIVMPCWVTVVDSWAGLSAHSHRSSPTAYDFHWFHSGSGITTGFTSGRVSFATAC